MKKLLILLILLILGLYFAPKTLAAPALGIHLLDPNELPQALDLASGTQENPGAVTVVLGSDEPDKEKWQKFLDLASDNHITPLIRLATNTQGDSWLRPQKQDIINHAQFLSSLNWHRDNLTVIIFNEPNHANEWGGQINPTDYSQTLKFALNWFHTESKNYHVLPAGLDAAANNTSSTMDSFTYLQKMISADPEFLFRINGWTSHSYPNPGFIGSPYSTGKMSIRGFEHELALLRQYSGKDYPVYITETGWKNNQLNSSQIETYYTYAFEKVWSQDNVKAITPFVFAAHSGPFQAFSFINSDGSSTSQYLVWKNLKLRPKQISLQSN